MTSPLRLLAAALGISIVLVAGVFAWEWSRFGFTAEAAVSRLEREVRAVVDERSGDVEGLAAKVAAEGRLILDATAAQALPALFERLQMLSVAADEHRVAVTVYVPDRGPSGYRVLAWSDGPGEQNLAPARLGGPAASFVAPGHAGLRLIRVEPVQVDDRRIAVAVAETVLAPTDRRSSDNERHLATSFGPVRLIERYASTRDEVGIDEARPIALTTRAGEPLLEVQVDEAELAARRLEMRRAALALALVPFPLALGLLSAPLVVRRNHAVGTVNRIGWTAVVVAVVAASVSTIIVLASWGGLPAAALRPLVALGCLGGVALTIGHIWWRPTRSRESRHAPAMFVGQHLVAGGALLAALEMAHRLVRAAITPEVLGQGQSVLFPFVLERLLSFVGLLLGEVAIGWAAVAALAAVAVRWRYRGPGLASFLGVVLWLCPTVLRLVFAPLGSRVATAFVVAALAAAACGIAARRVRRLYRHTTASLRLVAGFSAILAPLVVFYPLSAALTDDATERLVAEDYAPVLARHQQELRRELADAQEDVERRPDLADLVATPPSANMDTQAAFLVWRQTSLSRSRITSDVEIFGPNGALVSRFGFNLPDYVYRTAQQVRQGSGCRSGSSTGEWDVFGENIPFGAEERSMLHADRAVCDADGRLLGGIVLHVLDNDYQALPFVASPNPYDDVVGTGGVASTVRLPDLRIAVYGWSQQLLFTSGQAAWPLPEDTFTELYRTGQPVWRTLAIGDRPYSVHFSQNRTGVYAIGFPRPTATDHASRLAEIAAVVAVLFIALQVGALAYSAVSQGRPAPLRLLLHEIRTSFYRKLFLSFVAVAVLPVVVAAITFGAYMTSRFEADVEREAGSTVAVARRVFEELEAAGGQAAANSGPAAATDDALVWIRQVTGEDVNYFEGSELKATSQRDLFEAGLLPTRTPANVFRGIALERRPTLVADDRVGEFTYVVAAAPVPSRGAEAILTVPLAPRQRELSAELETLNSRVLVGAVLVVLFAAVLGSSLAGRVADPVARLTRATRQIAAGRLDVRIASESADELRTLVDDFNSMTATLVAQRGALARTNQLKAWNEMARQVAHEIKNPLTPVQLAAEHLQHVHEDRGRPLGAVVDQCVSTILTQVRLLRRIASEFANFSSEPISRPTAIAPAELVESVIQPYRVGVAGRVVFDIDVPTRLPEIWADRTLMIRALTNLAENALQAMPSGGTLRVTAALASERALAISFRDSGAGMDEATVARAFEPFFSTKAGGSGLGLANAKRAVEREGGSIAIQSTPGVGTTVTMTLPLAADPRGGATASQPSR